MMCGPFLYTIMPMIMHEKKVGATFIIRSSFTYCVVSPKVSWMEVIKDAWLNQTKNLRKKANLVRCKVRVFLRKETA